MRPIRGRVRVPGDKSISHRAVMLASLADGSSRIRGFLDSEDTLRTVRMVESLGVAIVRTSPTELQVEGRGVTGLREPPDVIDAGNSGTTMRVGAGLLAGQGFVSVVTGDRSLRDRPMDRVVEPLRRMGARVEGRASGTRAPLCFAGGELHELTWVPPVPSAQVKSCLLLAGLRARGPVRVIEETATRDHTERMLRVMGARVRVRDTEVEVGPAGRLDPLDIVVPGDFSAATFFMVLAAAVPGSRVLLEAVGVNPTRTALLDVLSRMGAGVEVRDPREESGEPMADIVVRGRGLRAVSVSPGEVPGLVDELPALCVAAALAEGRFEVRGAGELRVKESDRIRTMVEALTTLGIPCGESEDGLWIENPARSVRDGTCETRGDHRIAMALMVLGAASGREIRLTDAGCVATSFPDFPQVLGRLIHGDRS